MKKDITRAIINATVDRSLREINEDPRRSIRKLTDLGRHFSKGRLMQPVYDIFQDLLKNDDSPYYSAIEHLLQHTDRKNLNDFGINMGYNSLTKGGKTIRKLKETKGCLIPWSVIIRVENSDNKLSAADVFSIIAQGKKLGIFSYVIRLEKDLSCLEDIANLMKSYADCDFMLILPDFELTASVIENLKLCTNTLFFINASGDYSDTNALLFRRRKIWYGTYDYYDESTYESMLNEEDIWNYITQESAFLLMIAKDGTSPDVVKRFAGKVKQMRLSPVAPLFPFDLYGDTYQIQKIIAEQSCWFEIMSDGSYNTDRGAFPKKEGLPDLDSAFREIFKQ